MDNIRAGDAIVDLKPLDPSIPIGGLPKPPGLPPNPLLPPSDAGVPPPLGGPRPIIIDPGPGIGPGLNIDLGPFKPDTPKVGPLLKQFPSDSVQSYVTASSTTTKEWAENYHGLSRNSLLVHSIGGLPAGPSVHVDLTAGFLSLRKPDEELREQEPAYPPSKRHYEFYTKADIETWWHTEVSNVVLAAFHQYPKVVQVSQHTPRDEDVAETVDVGYLVEVEERTQDLISGFPKVFTHKYPLAIGQIKRNVIQLEKWLSGDLGDVEDERESQQNLAKELRGYAVMYKCPQVFCFDREVLLMLQFRANTVSDIKDKNCLVDCWVVPRVDCTISMREALYRFLVQGFRKVQGFQRSNWPAAAKGSPRLVKEDRNLQVGIKTPTGSVFYNGLPIWTSGVEPFWDEEGKTDHLEPGWTRLVDKATGKLYWMNPSKLPTVYETLDNFSFWRST